MILMLRKEASYSCIHGLAHIPTPNCLADCLTKASAEADNLNTAVKTGRLLDLDIHPNFRTLKEHKAFLSTWCRTYLHTRENDVFLLNTLKISLASDLQEGPFHVMFARNQHCDERNELNMCEFESQDATKITSASTDSRVTFSWMTRSFWVEHCVCVWFL